jgi:hypothetical protein
MPASLAQKILVGIELNSHVATSLVIEDKIEL